MTREEAVLLLEEDVGSNRAKATPLNSIWRDMNESASLV